jgi:hypothetical protein
MAQEQAGESLERGGIRFSKYLLAEIDRGHPVLRIARADVQRIALRRGFLAARPMVQAILGIGLMVPIFYILLSILLTIYGGGRGGGGVDGGEKLIGYSFIGILLFGLIGGWLLLGAFKRGYYVEVTKGKGTEKLRFDRRLPQAEIEAFLASVRSQLGWTIDPL